MSYLTPAQAEDAHRKRQTPIPIDNLREKICELTFGCSYESLRTVDQRDVEELETHIKRYSEQQEIEARIAELKHIDDPINVSLYWEGLVSVDKRLAELEDLKGQL
jgi:hypothetical protein